MGVRRHRWGCEVKTMWLVMHENEDSSPDPFSLHETKQGADAMIARAKSDHVDDGGHEDCVMWAVEMIVSADIGGGAR